MRGSVTVSLKGPLFRPTMTAGVIGVMNNVVEDVADMAIPELQKRFKKGKGRDTGRLAASFDDRGLVKPLEAQVVSDVSYAHRVEYGSPFMPGQKQRKNTRKKLLKTIKNEMAPAIVDYLS